MAVTIKSIKVYQVDLALHEPFEMSGGRLIVDNMDTTIVAVETHHGLVGWGESCPFGNAYLPAFADGVRAGIGVLAPLLIGENPLHVNQIYRYMDAGLAGHPYVKTALDMAFWDILGKHTGLPVYTLLGGQYSSHGNILGGIASGSPAEIVSDLTKLREAGYRYFSPKIGGDVSLDIARIRAVLNALQADEKLTIDANRAWLPDQAIQIMNAIEDTNIYFEQPCETLEECGAVRQLTQHPMILDECIHNMQDLIRAHQLGIPQAINIKIGRVGGLTKAREMRDFCVATGLRMNIEETGGSHIAATAAIHLAVATPLRYRLASSDSTWFHSTLTTNGGYKFESGKAVLTDASGLGLAPIMEVLGEPIAVYK